MCRRSAATTCQLDSGPRWQQSLSVHSMIALCCPEPITRGRRCGRDAPLPPFLDKRCSSVMPSKRDRATTTAVRGIRRRVSFRNHKALSDANGSTSAGRSAPVPAAAALPRAGVQRRPLARAHCAICSASFSRLHFSSPSALSGTGTGAVVSRLTPV